MSALKYMCFFGFVDNGVDDDTNISVKMWSIIWSRTRIFASNSAPLAYNIFSQAKEPFKMAYILFIKTLFKNAFPDL